MYEATDWASRGRMVGLSGMDAGLVITVYYTIQ